LVATVRRPAVEIEVPHALPPTTVHVTVVGWLLTPATVAVKSWYLPLTMVADAGFTVTPVTVGCGTVTVAVPCWFLLRVEVAVIVRVALVSLEATTRPPLELICVPPHPETAHSTLCGGLLVPKTVAVKFCIPPLATDTVAGLTVIPVTVGLGGSSSENKKQPLIENPITATATIIPRNLNMLFM